MAVPFPLYPWMCSRPTPAELPSEQVTNVSAQSVAMLPVSVARPLTATRTPTVGLRTAKAKGCSLLSQTPKPLLVPSLLSSTLHGDFSEAPQFMS